MKNRKLISFLSLFSLVLILGVYYSLQPSMSNNTNDGDNNLTVNTGEDAYFLNLDLGKEEQRMALIEEQSEVVSSPTSTLDEKITALELISTTRSILSKEKEIASLIKQAGYQNAYVEYEDKTINLLVSKASPTTLDAATIISLVYKKIGNMDYSARLTFK